MESNAKSKCQIYSKLTSCETTISMKSKIAKAVDLLNPLCSHSGQLNSARIAYLAEREEVVQQKRF